MADIDRNSITWKTVADHVAEKLTAAETMLKQRGLGRRQTEYERGAIDALQSVLDLGNPSAGIREFIEPVAIDE